MFCSSTVHDVLKHLHAAANCFYRTRFSQALWTSVDELGMQHDEEIEFAADAVRLGRMTVSDIKFLLDDFMEIEAPCS